MTDTLSNKKVWKITRISGATTITTSAAEIHSVSITQNSDYFNNIAASGGGGLITIYDNTTDSAPKVFEAFVSQANTVIAENFVLDAKMLSGIDVQMQSSVASGGMSGYDVTITWR